MPISRDDDFFDISNNNNNNNNRDDDDDDDDGYRRYQIQRNPEEDVSVSWATDNYEQGFVECIINNSSSSRSNKSDKVKLYWRRYEPKNALLIKATVVIVHDFGETCGMYAHVATYLMRLNYTVILYDQRQEQLLLTSPHLSVVVVVQEVPSAALSELRTSTPTGEHIYITSATLRGCSSSGSSTGGIITHAQVHVHRGLFLLLRRDRHPDANVPLEREMTLLETQKSLQ